MPYTDYGFNESLLEKEINETNLRRVKEIGMVLPLKLVTDYQVALNLYETTNLSDGIMNDIPALALGKVWTGLTFYMIKKGYDNYKNARTRRHHSKRHAHENQ